MLARIALAVALAVFVSCGVQSDREVAPSDYKELNEMWAQSEKTWASLERHLSRNHFWMAPFYSRTHVAFMYGTLVDAHRNPILVSIWKTPIWCHVDLQPAELEQIQLEQTHADSLSVGVLGRVTSINWYTKHITIRSLQTSVTGAN